MKRMVLVSMFASLLTGGSGPAMADDLRGDLPVMRPNGTVLRISSPSADAWWEDYYGASCVSCKGLQQAAELFDEVGRAVGTRFNAGPRHLILLESLELGWPHAWLFYPSTDRTPAYVVRHGGVRAGGLQRDVWMPATERMEGLILEGGGDPLPSPKAPSATQQELGSFLGYWSESPFRAASHGGSSDSCQGAAPRRSEAPECSVPCGRTVRPPAHKGMRTFVWSQAAVPGARSRTGRSSGTQRGMEGSTISLRCLRQESSLRHAAQDATPLAGTRPEWFLPPSLSFADWRDDRRRR